MNSQRTSQLTPSAEPLESRRLLAATIVNGVLVGTGTSGADAISVRRVLTDDVIVTINGVGQQFDMDDFTGVRLEGLGGNDTFSLLDPLVSPVVRNTTVIGGDGNDTISYETRTAAISFWIDPTGPSDSGTPGAASGAQQDHFRDVETIIGGSGGDSFQYAQRNDTDVNDPTSFRLEGRGGNDRFFDLMFPDADAFGAVTMLGGSGNDIFVNESDQRFNREFFFGEAGNDVATFYSLNRGAIEGGPGTDTIHFRGTLGEMNAVETGDLADFPGFDNATKAFGRLIGTDGPNDLRIGSGGTILGLGGNDTLVGGEGNERLDGGAGDDRLTGGFGDDTLDAGAGIDTVDGGPGNDTIIGAEVQPPPGTIGIVNGVLIADGQWGQDQITIERTGTDDVIVRVNEVPRQFDMDDFSGVRLRGNAGFDDLRVLDAIVAGTRVRKVTLEGGAGDDTLNGYAGDDVLRGGDGDDFAFGSAGNDALFGGRGNDTLIGAEQSDFLDGGDGDDVLAALDGFTDTLVGGPGRDVATVNPSDQLDGVEVINP